MQMRANNNNVMKVDIYGNSFSIKKPQDADEEKYIRELATYVNKVMNQIRQKTGIVSVANVAVMAALNIAKEMHDEKQRYAETVQELIKALEETIAEPYLRKREEADDYGLYLEEEE